MLILLQRASANVPNPPAGKSTLFVDTNGNFNVLNSNGGYGSFNGSFVAIGNVDLGNVGNIFIADGANGQVLKSYGANGHVYWGDDSATPGGSNTQVQFNDAGGLGGSTGLTFDKAAGVLFVTGNVSAGNVSATTFTGALSGNATTAGTVTTAAQPNITSVGTLTSVSASGNANVGNLGTGIITATGNVTGANLITGGLVSATGNVTGANLITGGLISATGTVTGGNLVSGATISAAGNVTGANIFTSGVVNANGNIIVQAGSFFIGNGSQLSGIDATAIQNGNSNVQVIANGIVTTSVSGNANVFAVLGTGIQANGTVSASGTATVGNVSTTGIVSATGNVTGGNLVTAGNVFAGQLVANGGAYDTRLSISTSTGIIEANSTGNATQFLPGGQVRLSASAPVVMSGTSDGSQLVLGTTQTDVNQLRGGDVTLQVGASGTAVSVLRFQNAGNLVAPAAISAAGNVTGANLITGGLLTVTGNASVGNLTTAGLVSATGNIVATGNVAGGNLTTAGLVSATGNIVTSANLVTDLIAGKTSSVSITATGTNQNINLTPTGTGTVNVGNFIISNVQTPVNDYDAATKKYVDDVSQGLNIHDAVAAATPSTLATITSGTITYNNGANGVGANLTTTGSFNLIDGVNVQTSGTRILVKNEANAVYNGIYTWSNATVITRATDFNTVPEVEAGDFVFVNGGTLYDNTGWVQTDSPAAIGTAGNTITFTQFSGAGTYTAGTGLALNGSTFSIGNTTVVAGAYGNGDYNATFTVNSQGQLSAAANVAITANAANLSGTVLKSTVVTSSLTSVGTLASLSVSGNANVGNLGTAGLITASGNITGGNIIGTLVTGTITTAAQPNITSVGSLASLSVVGNANVGNIGGGAGIYTTLSASGNVTGGNLVSTGQVGGTGATHLGNTFTTGANTTTATVTGNFSLSTGSRFQATYA